MSKYKAFHLHPNRLNRGRNILLLLVPPIIFAIILLIFQYRSKLHVKQEQVAIEVFQESNVLGKDAGLDISPQRLSK